MTPDEALHAVRKICSADGTEEEIAALVSGVRHSFPHSKIINLIFHDFRDLTPEQIVAEAMQRELDHAGKVREI